MNSNSKGRTSSAGGRTNRNCKSNTSNIVKEEVKTVTPEKLNQEVKTLAPKAEVKTVASKVEVKPMVEAKSVKVEVKPVATTKSVKEEVKPVATKVAKEGVKSRTSKTAKTETKKPVKTETKKTAAIVTSELNYREILGDEPIKVIEIKDKKSVSNYKINVVLKNYNYHKVIKALVTEDSWETSREVELKYISANDDNIELWGTSIKIDAKKVENFQYVVSYDVNGEIYWDNNYGNDYKY